jgi:hypothetical protein
MTPFICETCGTQFPPTDAPPSACPICEDERQYLRPTGQRWISPAELSAGHANAWRWEEPGLLGIVTTPGFAIGQRALLVRTGAGNVLWDCLSLFDEATAELVRALGGLAAIAISHPHYYSSMVEWARAFNAPVWLHEADRRWVMREDPHLCFWSGPTNPLLGGMMLIHTPGHFDGAAVLHWPQGAEGRGSLLAGDIVQVAADRKTAGFMRSYPNWIPLGPKAVRRIADALEPFAFDRVYGPFTDRVIAVDGQDAVARSVVRALKWLAD